MEKNNKQVTIGQLSIEQKIGQMVIAQAFGRYRGKRNNYFQSLRDLVDNYYISGFKLYHGFGFETCLLTNNLNSYSKIPLFFAADLERGLGQQINDAPCFPPAAALGISNDDIIAKKVGQSIASDALLLGINMIFAPLLDLYESTDSYFGSRCIARTPEIVSKIGVKFLEGVRMSGAISTAKYFPGNGKQIFFPDGSTIINRSYQELDQYEWIPFKEAIDLGVDAVMVSHGAFPFLDKSIWDSVAGVIPAALSKEICTNILRNNLKFSGLIITDALNLPFLRNYSMRKIACKAVSAGSDLLVALTTPEDAEQAIYGIYDALEKGHITEVQINRSVSRILKAKKQLTKWITDTSSLQFVEDSFCSDETLRMIEKLSRESIKIIKNTKIDLPIHIRPLKIYFFIIGNLNQLCLIQSDHWFPWHETEEFDLVFTDWSYLDPQNMCQMELVDISDFDIIILTLLNRDMDTINMYHKVIKSLSSTNKMIISALPLPMNDACQISVQSETSFWLPDFSPVTRNQLIAEIIGEGRR
jgi:beta-N-acetylhexosaminidase